MILSLEIFYYICQEGKGFMKGGWYGLDNA